MPSLFSSGGRFARRFRTLVAALAAPLFLASALPALTVGFEDLSLATPPAQSGFGGIYYNGSDNAGGWSSGGVGFNNSFTDFGGGYTTWGGFAYSTTTDTTTAGFTNQYSAIAGGGADGSGTYAVAYYDSFAPVVPAVAFGQAVAPQTVSVTNVAYAFYSLRDGDAFSKKFGGASGDDPDFFSVTFTGYDAGHVQTGQVTFLLADFRFADNNLDYIVDEWTTVDLTALGIDVFGIELSFASSDAGAFGINTPVYVALDQLAVSTIPEPAACTTIVGGVLFGLAALRRRRQAPRS